KIAGLTQELPVVSVSQLGETPAPIPLTETVAPSPPAPLPTFGTGEDGEPAKTREVPAAAPVQQFPPASVADAPSPEPAAPSSPLHETGKADPAHPVVRPTELTTVAGKLPGDGSRNFTVTPEAVRVEVRGEVLIRTAGLLGWTGVIEARAEFKRFRGRTTDKPFGWGPARMHRLLGTGTAWLGVMGRTFLAVDLGDESVYLREDWVFGFEDSVMFENGRVPSEVAPDLDLVHLSGVGQVLLALPGPLRSTEVRHDAPVTVPLQHWVGWQGQLSPRVVALGWEGPEGTPAPAVELSGEGVALLCVPNAAG
ncbi:MAG TPA: hypothetical protein VFE93_04205, partial [Myxococcaceae bacterium]|nr:hypothetical protein [Myxococcaceae bacterium]